MGEDQSDKLSVKHKAIGVLLIVLVAVLAGVSFENWLEKRKAQKEYDSLWEARYNEGVKEKESLEASVKDYRELLSVKEDSLVVIRAKFDKLKIEFNQIPNNESIYSHFNGLDNDGVIERMQHVQSICCE